jgi:molybdenum ABC transporter molybdate-binding protein
LLSFRLVKKLRHFTVDISEQVGTETLVLIGHSGCGKSTTLRMLSGLLSPDEGIIRLDDRMLWKREDGVNVPPEGRNIGYVFQNYALFPHLSVMDNVAYGIAHLPVQEKSQRVEETLDFLGIRSLAHAKPAMLSGGEQQRVALARALVTRPKLLLLDEPLSALDVSTRAFVRAELKQLLRKLSIPTIVVTHDFEDARVLADRIAVMDRGRIIQSGSQREIARHPVNRFIAEFAGTNLIRLKEETGSVSSVAFDPWKVELSRERGNSRYEWEGSIHDIAWIGGSVRLHIQGADSFLADIPLETFDNAGFQVGDTVFAWIAESDARIVASGYDDVDKSGTVQEDKQDLYRQSSPNRKRWRWALTGLIVLLLASIGAAYGFSPKPAGKTRMVAFVAANATDPFNAIIEKFGAQHPEMRLEATYAGTQVLRTQLEQGAKADLFLSADMSHIEAVKEEGLIDRYVPVSRNHEVIVVPQNNPAGIHSLQDLAAGPVKLIIGTETVPIGKYTRMILQKANKGYGEQFSKRTLAHVVSLETDVKQVLQKVALGEAEAGIVYRTDVTDSFANKVTMIEIPSAYNVEAINYIAVLKHAPNPELAGELMKLLLSPEGQQVFADFHYEKASGK